MMDIELLRPELPWNEIALRYQSGHGSPRLAKEYGCSKFTVLVNLERLGVPRRDPSSARREYACDHAFFDTVDTEAKAYWLGFIAADGSITEGGNVLSITLGEQDADHLALFRDALGDPRPIRFYEPGRVCKDGRKMRLARYSVASREMAAGLAVYGVVPRKSQTVPWPALPGELLPHYLRGYIDGDGCFSVSSGKLRTIQFRLVGNEPFLQGCAAYLESQGIPRPRVFKHSENCNIYCLCCGGTNRVRKVAELVYAGASVWLGRKRDLVDHFRPSRPHRSIDRTECLRGHPTSPENTCYTTRNGLPAQVCRVCRRQEQKGLRRRQARSTS